MPNAGEKAPDFRLSGIDANRVEREYSLSELLSYGKPLVLYFYPKDNTPGCTIEACDFRDNMNRVAARATVVGVSPDSPASHVKFNEKQSLNFPLLSDPDKKVIEAYEAWGEKNMYGKISVGVVRSTYIIGPDGIILRKMLNVKAKGHVDKLLEELSGL